MRTSGEALLTIIDDILDFSKIESGKLALEQSPFELTTCVEAALDLVSARAATQGLELAYFIEPSTPAWIVGDVNRLRQILVNLLSNAVKFTQTGEVVVSITSKNVKVPASLDARAERHPHAIQFAVKDTGIGIAPEHQQRLFQAFSQADLSITRQYGGTGLGLAISKRLSEAMGGTIWVESQVNQGSTFFFTIQAMAAEAKPAAVSCQEALSTISLQNQRVLIVDDNATNRRILSWQTQSWGMIPTSLSSAAEALARLKQGTATFEVALLDVQMPTMDGLTLTQEIQKLSGLQPFPIILLSSIGQVVSLSQPPSGCVVAALSKPIKKAQLLRVLRQVMAQRSQQVQSGGSGAVTKIDVPSSVVRGTHHPLRILVAEDNVVNQKVALKILQRLGYDADLVDNGQSRSRGTSASHL